MRKFWKSYFSVFVGLKLSILISCQQPVSTNDDLKMGAEPSKKNESVQQSKQQLLSPAELEAVFPKQLSGLERTNVIHNPLEGGATASYGDNKYMVNIIDDLRYDYLNVYLFNGRYQKAGKTDKRIVRTVRDGYKTIATIDKKGITSISFVFKHRFLITITGNQKQTPYMVWRFLELNKFQIPQ